MIVKELFANLAILVALIFGYTQLTNATPLQKFSSFKRKIFLGVIGGLLSNILMQYSMMFGSTIIDFRQIPIILLAYYGGTVPAVVALLFVITGRFLIGVNFSSFLALIYIVSITFLAIYLSSTKLKNRVKEFSILTCSNILFSVVVAIAIDNRSILIGLIPAYWLITYFAGGFSFYIVEYLRNYQTMVNRYKMESVSDGLTGLHNVRKFDEVFNKLITNVNHNEEMLSLLYIDIDHFKKINDTYGHKEGDMVLKQLGMVLKTTARSFDFVSRNGGEEFTVILLDCPLKRAIEMGEKIRKAVEEHPFTLTDDEEIRITISVGIACYNETTLEPSHLIEEADKALYQAKRTGRNRVCVAG
ncbi:diguanylate cyclase [Bacillus coahuilensis p1.1.43]|uniref:Diguanylate cyclase n=1 Tax=Bacillus coahuilensis p1.1.43 TaxID=1150625 RepID=A0A147K660_9BACI|nr:diguanylate cyclase [Bacillus coahuilensis]KUP05248.1 diguanylate cyclase [Bacillus coahuilensis p1.1.43]